MPKAFLGIALLLITSFPVSSFAGFAIAGVSSLENSYGNAQTVEFERAVRGNTNPLGRSYQRDEELFSRVAMPINNRYYFNANLQYAFIKLEDIEAGSGGGIAGKEDEEDEGINFEIAMGYKWHNWRHEIQWLISKSVDLEFRPAITGITPLRDFEGDVSVHYLLWNWYRDLPHFRSFEPYFGGGIGMGIVTTEVDALTTGGVKTDSTSTDKVRLAFNMQLGFNYRLTNNLFAGMSYEFLCLDGFDIGPVDGQRLKVENTVTHGLNFGLTYIF